MLISIVPSHSSSNKLHSVHPSSISAGGVGRLSLLLIFKKEGFDRISVLRSQRVVAEKDRADVFPGWVAVFTKKKTEI